MVLILYLVRIMAVFLPFCYWIVPCYLLVATVRSSIKPPNPHPFPSSAFNVTFLFLPRILQHLTTLDM